MLFGGDGGSGWLECIGSFGSGFLTQPSRSRQSLEIRWKPARCHAIDLDSRLVASHHYELGNFPSLVCILCLVTRWNIEAMCFVVSGESIICSPATTAMCFGLWKETKKRFHLARRNDQNHHVDLVSPCSHRNALFPTRVYHPVRG